MDYAFSRTEMLIGKEGMDRLKGSRAAVFGIGGVGSYAVEALARCGIGSLVLVDADDVEITNINRQIHATTETLGRPKVEVMKERILDINPEAEVITYKQFYDEAHASQLIKQSYTYIIDAIDTISSKISLITQAHKQGIRIISCMGMGNKLDPSRIVVDDIYKTSICPLAKVVRKELRKRGIESLKVVYSKEEPLKPKVKEIRSPGSISFVPSVAGLIMAGVVVQDIIN